MLTESPTAASWASPAPTSKSRSLACTSAWGELQAVHNNDDRDGYAGAQFATPLLATVASSAERDFSFKREPSAEIAVRELVEEAAGKLAQLKKIGWLNEHSSVKLEVETCGGQSWQTKSNSMLARLSHSLQQLKVYAVQSDGVSILQYAGLTHSEGRLGAFEVYIVIHFNTFPANSQRVLLHSKLKTQRYVDDMIM